MTVNIGTRQCRSDTVTLSSLHPCPRTPLPAPAPTSVNCAHSPCLFLSNPFLHCHVSFSCPIPDPHFQGLISTTHSPSSPCLSLSFPLFPAANNSSQHKPISPGEACGFSLNLFSTSMKPQILSKDTGQTSLLFVLELRLAGGGKYHIYLSISQSHG